MGGKKDDAAPSSINNNNNNNNSNNNSNNNNNKDKSKDKENGNSNIFKLLLGAGGIFTAFTYYGVMHEEIFEKSTGFTQAWFLQAVEASANVLVGGLGLALFGKRQSLQLDLFALSGLTQV